jgi:hypothetical protein
VTAKESFEKIMFKIIIMNSKMSKRVNAIKRIMAPIFPALAL